MKLLPIVNNIDIARDRLRRLIQEDERPFCVCYSAGKDSTLMLQLLCEALEAENCKRKTYVMFNDTRLETGNKLERIEKNFKRFEKLGFETVLTRPLVGRSYFSLLLGRGYRAPDFFWRWCTYEIKKRPAEKKFRELAMLNGGLLKLSGIRGEESRLRQKKINDVGAPEKIEVLSARQNLSCVYPIAAVSTDEVWDYLNSLDKFYWGETSQELREVYDNGNGKLRDGCWVCTVCSESKKKPCTTDAQTKIRNYIRDMSNNPAKLNVARSKRQKEMIAEGRAAGYFNMDARREMLKWIQNVEKETGERFIFDDEIEEIEKIWNEMESN